MAEELLYQRTRLPIPHTDGCVFGAGYDVPLIKAHVQHASSVALQTANGSVIVLDVPDNAGEVRRPSDHDLFIKLKAKNGSTVVVGALVNGSDNSCREGRRRTDGEKRRFARRLLSRVVDLSNARDLARRRANDLTARPRVMSIPHPDGSITRTSDDFVSVKPKSDQVTI
jgi:hypothetical protein